MKDKKQFLVIGLGNFGKSFALSLEEMGCDVIAIDSDEQLVQNLSTQLTYVVSGNAADEKTLHDLGAENTDVAVIAVSDLQISILCTLQLKDMGVKNIIVRARDNLHGKILEKIGATRIVYPERETARRLANIVYSDNIHDYVDYLEGTGLLQIDVPENLVGKHLIDADLRKRFNINVILITRGNERITSPDPTAPLQAGDKMVLFGSREDIYKARQALTQPC